MRDIPEMSGPPQIDPMFFWLSLIVSALSAIPYQGYFWCGFLAWKKKRRELREYKRRGSAAWSRHE